MKYMLITNDSELAKHAVTCGVARIFIDLEYIGKKERQGHLDTVMSNHSVKDVSPVKRAIGSAELLVRINPLHDDTESEIESVIGAGANLIMLPMFQSCNEVQKVASIIRGRVPLVPLVETKNSLGDLENITKVEGVGEIYIGLNDLSIDMGFTFMFEPLANGLIDKASKIIHQADLPFGFGGIARVCEGVVPGELILAEHIRLGSSSVILSRTFHRRSEGVNEFQANNDLQLELQKLIEYEEEFRSRTPEQSRSDFRALQHVIKEFVSSNE